MDDIAKKFSAAYEYMDGLSVYEVRNIAREMGIRSPTTEKKGELIDQIISVEAGLYSPAVKTSNKGAPTKAAKVPEAVIRDIKRLIAEGRQIEPYPAPSGGGGVSITFRDSDPAPSGYGDGIYGGILEMHPQGYGFLRAENCEPGKKDVFVSAPVIHKFKLKSGDQVQCYVKQNRDSGSPALERLAAVNGRMPSGPVERPDFDDLTPRYPDERILLGESGKLSLRCIDLMCPIGKGQRGLIVSPPKAGKTTLLKDIARSIAEEHTNIHLIILLIDERPEEVTDMQESIPQAEIVYSTFDESAEHHVEVSRLILDRAKRIAESGGDVVILLDSITKLTRAYNNVVPSSGKILSGGLDPAALGGPKKFFGSARSFGKEGSLTILATALVDTGSRMDDVIYEEFKGTGNMEIHLSRDLAERRVFPAIDIYRSGTRKEELLLGEQELACSYAIRRTFAKENATELLFELMKKTKSNEELAATAGEWSKTYKAQR